MDKKLSYNIEINMTGNAATQVDALNSYFGQVNSSVNTVNRSTEQLSLSVNRLGTATASAAQSGKTFSANMSLASSASLANYKAAYEQVERLKIALADTTGNAGQATEALSQAGNVVPRFNALNVSVQQVARELPALAISANTFFLAISNNLPILADSISAARRQNEALIASGQKAVPVWRQVAGSLLSWQTALVLGITALSVYGSDIIAFIRNLVSAGDALANNQLKIESVSRATGSYNTQLTQESYNLRIIYDRLTRSSAGTAERKAAIDDLNKTYGTYMPYLLSEASSLSEINTAYTAINESLRQQVGLKVKSAETDKIIEEAAKTQTEAIDEIRESLQDNGISDSLAQALITRLVQDVPKWREAGDDMREAFLNAIKNIQSDFPTIRIDSQARRGINEYIQSVYVMEDALDGVNKRVDLLQGKSDQITTIGEVVVTPADQKDTQKDINKDLTTTGGLMTKIQQLQEAQLRATTSEAVALELKIRALQEELELRRKMVVAGAEGNLATQSTGNLAAPDIVGLQVPAIQIPIEFDQAALQRANRDYQKSLLTYEREATVTSRQISGMLSSGISSFASGLGEALASGSGIEIFQNTLLSLMGMLQQFGSALIATGTAALALSTVLAKPFLAIAAGAALVTTAAFAKSIIQNATAFADGGIVSGPTLAMVGEYSGAANNPEVIAPLNKLKSLIDVDGDKNSFGDVTFRIEGTTLVGILNKMNNRNKRTR